MSAEHSHPNALTAGAKHRKPLLTAFGLTFAFMIVEVVAGLATNSLAILSDAGHMLTDVVGLGMALAAIQVSQSRRDPAHTYGLYRLEILASVANAVLLFAVAGYVLYEASQRFSDPAEVPGAPLLIVAVVGLAVNLISFQLLRAGAEESLNVRGAFLEVLSDALGSAGVLVAGIVLMTTGWPYADPIVGAAIGLFILPRAWRLGAAGLRILLEIAPKDVSIDGLTADLAAVDGVVDVHDLHVWTLTSGLNAATGHLRLNTEADASRALTQATEVLRTKYAIEHVTLQCEPEDFNEHSTGV